METKAMNNKPDFSFWSRPNMKLKKEEEEDQSSYSEYIRKGVKDMSYKKAIKKHEKELKQEQFVANILEDKIVVKPVHYEKFAIEPITFIMKNGLEFWRGNIVKYAVRCGHKTYDGMSEVESEIIDLKKVIRYAEMRINQLEGKEPNAIS